MTDAPNDPKKENPSETKTANPPAGAGNTPPAPGNAPASQPAKAAAPAPARAVAPAPAKAATPVAAAPAAIAPVPQPHPTTTFEQRVAATGSGAASEDATLGFRQHALRDLQGGPAGQAQAAGGTDAVARMADK